MPFSLLPRRMLRQVTEITPELLGEHGVKSLLLDFDNTIVPYTTDQPAPEVLRWLEAVRQRGVFLCVVSNSHRPRVVRFCERHDLACVTHSRKPFQKGIRKALLRYGLRPGETALAGDQIYTDVLGANCGGLMSILVRPLRLHNIWLKLRRGLELPWIGLAKLLGR